ncbi:MAG: hypothetical protein ACI8RD_000568 [Bacillariaceae sp.]|jgi:hypothetical protein
MDDDTSIQDCCVLPEAIEARTLEIGRDRRAYSRCFIHAGEVIIRNLPTAHTLFDEHQRERCSRCLSTTRRQFQNSNNKNSLLRCGGCKQAWYCSRECQKLDFSLHRVECKEAPILFSLNDGHGSSNSKLLVRNFLALRLKDGKVNNNNCCQHRYDNDLRSHNVTIQCGKKHFEKLIQYSNGHLEDQEMIDIRRAAQALWNQRKVLNKILMPDIDDGDDDTAETVVIHDRSELEDQLERDMRRFRVNNFGVTDSLVRVIGGAVYTLGALLNHSCSPNCLLRYDLSSESSSQRHEPPVMEVIAAQDIPIGEELTHSYIELVSSKNSRISNLKQMYGFDCFCPRCCCRKKANSDKTSLKDVGSNNKNDEFLIWLPNNYRSLSPTELTTFILHNYNPATSNAIITNSTKDKSHLSPFDQDIIFKSLNKNDAVIIEAIKVKQQQAKFFMMNGDLEDELSSLKEVVQILKQLTLASGEEQLPLSLELYQARCDRLGSLIVAGGQDNTKDALIECEHIVSFLCLALKHFPNHSLLGLQLFTLGDLYNSNGKSDEAQKTYTWARRNLQISQGNKSEMVMLLNEKIEYRS